MSEEARLARFAEIDRRLVQAAKSIQVLGRIAWPMGTGEEFLAHWTQGTPRLPRPPRAEIDFAPQREGLEEIIRAVDGEHPVGRYIQRTARSYLVAARMLESAGEPSFTELGAFLYARPTDTIGPGGETHLQAAEEFIRASAEFRAACQVDAAEVCILASSVANALRRAAVEALGEEGAPEIVLDPDLASKAAAGARRIRVRSSTCFSPFDTPQLIEHEFFVHTLTKLHGLRQPHLTSLGLGAPRTTLTQEGIATFAEMITDAMDLDRLRRIALRVKAIQIGLDGADFLDVFRFFLESGQTEAESFQSSARVFRGGDVRGGVVFLKDAIYLAGLFAVHFFLEMAVAERKLQYARHLFAGRLTLGDVLELEPYFESGYIATPTVVPRWVQNHHCLGAFLVYSHFTAGIDLASFSLQSFIESDETRFDA